MRKKRPFRLTQIRIKGYPTGLRFRDLTGTHFTLRISTVLDLPTLHLENEEELGALPVLNREMAQELARALLQFSDSGILVKKIPRPKLEHCPKCGHKSVDPRASWDEGDFRLHGPKCKRKDCTYAYGAYVSGPRKKRES